MLTNRPILPDTGTDRKLANDVINSPDTSRFVDECGRYIALSIAAVRNIGSDCNKWYLFR